MVYTEYKIKAPKILNDQATGTFSFSRGMGFEVYLD